MTEPTVGVQPTGFGHAVVCSLHGMLDQWQSPIFAAFAAMGHAASHHQEVP